MSAVAPIDLPIDAKTKIQLKRGERIDERTSKKSTLRGTKEKLTSKRATTASIIIAILWTTPTLGLLITSFRPAELINGSGWWTIFANPGFTLDNYNQVLNGSATTVNLSQSFVNSIAITIPAAIFPLVIAALAAYAFAWIPFRGRNILFIGVFALQVVPIQMALVPLLKLFNKGIDIGGVSIFDGLGAGHSYGQIWIAHTIFALPLAIFLLHNFISEIPQELIEAARVDGAGHGQTFFRIVLPLAMPAIASFAIFQFLWVWNDLLVALVFATDPSLGPITKVLREITGNRGQDWYLLTSGAFVAMIVPLIVFFALQRFFVRGLLAGSTKG
ncbi:carbohydrate ABC transporter permease [soil metagenome]